MIELICHLNDGWNPLIRPAQQTRDWMDASPEKYGYRCLPLNIANSHGWEILNPWDFSVVWHGGLAAQDVIVQTSADASTRPVSLFGQGTFTFHIQGLFRTSPGWNLWVGGSPNYFKDGVQALTGIVETDWAPFTFTMNWKLTRPGLRVEFKKDEPLCFIFPLQRNIIEEIEPRYVHFDDAPDVARQFRAWSRSRDDFHEMIRTNPPPLTKDHWQRHYFQGYDMEGNKQADHKSRLRPRPFEFAKKNV